jgi:hypothetical protein
MSSPQIRYLHREEVDVIKWDLCIEKAENGLIYGYSYYLDHMAKKWDALVLGDYTAVMPLTWNKKFGIYYLYQPAFTPSLGVFGNELDHEVVVAFLKKIPAKFRLIEISLNAGNPIETGVMKTIPRVNYILDLNPSYDLLYKGYRENIRRNVKKSQQLALKYETGVALEAILALSKLQMQKVSHVKTGDYKNFEALYQFLQAKKMAITCGVYLSGRLVSSAVYFFSHSRAYYILVGNHPDGKTVGGSHFLIDRFIHDHAGSSLTLDFEGSDIRNLAFFYESFGATAETFPFIEKNDLPWWVKVGKKLSS